MKFDLKPCPFCGMPVGRVDIYGVDSHGVSSIGIRCSCGAWFHIVGGEGKGAIEKWNQRASCIDCPWEGVTGVRMAKKGGRNDRSNLCHNLDMVRKVLRNTHRNGMAWCWDNNNSIHSEKGVANDQE